MEKNNAPHDIRHEEMLDFFRQNMINSLQLFFSQYKILAHTANYNSGCLAGHYCILVRQTSGYAGGIKARADPGSNISYTHGAGFIHHLSAYRALLPAVCFLLRLCCTVAWVVRRISRSGRDRRG